jgi:bacteriorhodopsin
VAVRDLGDRGYLLVLASFVAIYGVEHSAHVLPSLRLGKGEELILLWLRAAMLWAYGFLFLVTVPDIIAADLGFYAFTLGVGALAVAFKSYEVSLHHPRVYQRYGRWVIATGPIAGGLVDLLVARPSELLIDVLIAVVAGFIMLLAFTGSLLDHNRTKFGYFSVGVGLYVLAFLGRFTLLG